MIYIPDVMGGRCHGVSKTGVKVVWLCEIGSHTVKMYEGGWFVYGKLYKMQGSVIVVPNTDQIFVVFVTKRM